MYCIRQFHWQSKTPTYLIVVNKTDTGLVSLNSQEPFIHNFCTSKKPRGAVLTHPNVRIITKPEAVAVELVTPICLWVTLVLHQQRRIPIKVRRVPPACPVAQTIFCCKCPIQLCISIPSGVIERHVCFDLHRLRPIWLASRGSPSAASSPISRAELTTVRAHRGLTTLMACALKVVSGVWESHGCEDACEVGWN